MESTLRSMNNLLERLHASFFSYLLPHPGWFHNMGAYLPAVVLLGAGLTIRGLGLWVDAGWPSLEISTGQQSQWRRRDRQTHVAAGILASCFLVSWCFYRLRHFIAMVSGASVIASILHSSRFLFRQRTVTSGSHSPRMRCQH